MNPTKLFLKLALVLAIATAGLLPAPKAEAALPACNCTYCATASANDLCYCPGLGKSTCGQCGA